MTCWPACGSGRARCLSNVVEPIIDSRTDRATGVRTKDGRRFTALIVVAADGNSTG